MTTDPMQHASQRRYSSVAVALHWLIALAMAFQLALGFAMPEDQSGYAAYQLHKSAGIAILLLTLARLGWRLFRRPPAPVERGLGGLLARAVHVLFYAVLVLGPLSGWLLVSSAPLRVPTVLFGIVPWPHLPAPAGLYDASVEAHEVLAWVAIGLFVLHVAGALRHQLFLRDGLLGRMAPGGSAALAALLGLLTVALGGATFVLAGRPGPAGPPRDPAAPLPTVSHSPSPSSAPSPDAEVAAIEEGAAEEPEAEPAAPPVWTVQPGGRLGFAVSNGDDRIEGRFGKWRGTIAFDPQRPESAAITIEVDLASASVGDPAMNDMLQGAEFFASAANPRAIWRATSVTRTGPNAYAARGTLTLKGISRPQPIAFSLGGKGMQRSVRGTATIDRTAFGVGTGSSADNLGPRVSLDFTFDAVGKPG